MRKQTTQLKNGQKKDVNKYFVKETYRWKLSVLKDIRYHMSLENLQNKAAVRCYYTAIKMAKIPSSDDTKYCEDME